MNNVVYNYFYFGSNQFVSNLTRNPRNPQIYLLSESTSRWRWNFYAALRVESTEWHMFHSALVSVKRSMLIVLTAPAVVAKLATNSVDSFSFSYVCCIVVIE